MDKLLADSKIRFRPLPSLPPSSPGNFTIVGLDTEQAILETLWMPTLMTINFELEWKSKITKLRTVSSVRIRGIRYAEIADAVLKGRIGVVIDPAIAQDMIYTYRGTNANSFRARRSMTMALDDMAVIVHEATHAICDLEMIGNLDSIFNEAIAFVAECIFFRKAAGRIRPGGNADQNVLPSRHHPDRPQAETIPVVVSAGLAVQRNDVLLVGLVRH